jgi:hypothetical protein
MPAVAPYIPPKDAAFSNWFQNFSTLITAAPMTYGLLSSDAVTIAAQYADWIAAYNLVTSPSTKTAQAVSAKNTAKVTALAIIRPYAQQISLNPGVTSGNKIAMGVNPRTSTPSAVTAPVSNPVLTVQSASNLALILRYRDSSSSPSVKAKPYGVTQCRVFGATSLTPITDPTLLPLLATLTKSPGTVTFSPGSAGKQAYLAAQWATRTGLVSPWSPMVNFTVPAGM